MKLPVAVKAKWLKALRSGKYKQAKETLYDSETCGFCCLGVLEHVCMNGKVEDRDLPSLQFYEHIGAWVRISPFAAVKDAISDADIDELADMNDRGVPFKDIADHIDYRIGTI